MELLSPRTKSALDRLTELASGDRLLVLDALARYEHGAFKDARSLIDYLRESGRSSQSTAAPSATDLSDPTKQ